MGERWQHLIDELVRADGWTTAAQLADRLGVTTRTVRTWVANANAAGDAPVIRSGPDGYKIDRAALAAREEPVADPRDRPEGRQALLIRRLVDADDGLDLFETAAELHVSESTLEGDLTRVRARLGDSGLTLERHGPLLRLSGPEAARRRVLGDLIREESARGRVALDSLRRRFPALPGFREALIAGLGEAGFAPNEYAIDDVLLHLAIAVDRVTRDRTLESRAAGAAETAAAGEAETAAAGEAETAAAGAVGDTPAGDDPIDDLLDVLVSDLLGVRLPAADRAHLARLTRTRAATRLAEAGDPSVSPRATLVRDIVRRAASEYLVDLTDDGFIDRLALHVDNLAARSADRSFSRNPLTAQIKSAYPLIYELAVYVASELRRTDGIRVNDDEIAYLAMHLGAHLDRRRATDEVRVAIDVPAYHDLRDTLALRIAETAGDGVSVALATASDVSDADLVVAVVPPAVPVPRLVLVAPLPTPDDLERVRAEVVSLRRARRTARLAARLADTIEPDFFVRGLRGLDREAVIRMLGERLIAGGVVDRAYVEGAVERERMSSTAFADHLAVPHAMTMSARRTAIAIAIDDTAIDWAGTPVHVVALIAFADSGRAEFQEVFDQFVEAFSERENVLRLVRGATDHAGLVAELARLMEAAA
ncbi:BglG family transcription antiterminator [Agromyces aerolatus]|uniref:BglG family transcription antiterminator n=1 Tax=Agromyces sp. LY-1074 TaxID=3074080 RepID=UPI00285C2709|nr:MULTISPECIES: PTS sugar transporter subunit IIA [unclassified Agromyces]MDR5698381.1 PTS sugar transporter subunit IIA [Agromyces sp. LY-1074]MDR5704675.1 PTS sugar transporter subunit IIA [Agromyces sp. LY-1358]